MADKGSKGHVEKGYVPPQIPSKPGSGHVPPSIPVKPAPKPAPQNSGGGGSKDK